METLQSIKEQTIINFEVLICDDNSTDDTIKICESWRTQNPNIETRILISCQNNGITRNINTGYRLAKGLWLKPIAGDDTLKINCIEKFTAIHDNNHDVYFAECSTFSGTERLDKVLRWPAHIASADVSKIKKALLKSNFLPAPGSFIKRESLKSVGYADEEYKMLDDWPLWIKFAKNQLKFGFINEPLVNYRVSSFSASSTVTDFIPKLLRADLRKLYIKERICIFRPALSLMTALELICWEINTIFFRSKKSTWKYFRKIFSVISLGQYNTI